MSIFYHTRGLYMRGPTRLPSAPVVLSDHMESTLQTRDLYNMSVTG